MEEKVHFSEIDDKSKWQALQKASDTLVPFKVWEKGSEDRSYFLLSELNPKNKKALIIPKDGVAPSRVLLDAYVHFEVGGFQYFIKVMLEASPTHSGQYYVDLTSKCFKCERRNNFRLSTQDRFKCTLQIPVVAPAAKKNHLELLKPVEGLFEFTTFDVLDISVSGMSFLIDEEFKSVLIKDQVFRNCTLSFEHEQFEIPEIKIVYFMDFLGPTTPGKKKNKVAIRYMGLKQAVEERLFKLLTKKMRFVFNEALFEEFSE